MFWQNRLMLSAQGENQKREQFGDASVETGLAKQYLDDVLDDMSFMLQDQSSFQDVSEILEDQKQALEAVIRAIQAPQPPEQNQGDDNQEQKEQQNDVSQEQAQKKMQKAKKSGKQSALRNKKQVRQEPGEGLVMIAYWLISLGLAQEVSLHVQQENCIRVCRFLTILASDFEEEPVPEVAEFIIDGCDVQFLGVDPQISRQVSIVNGQFSNLKK